MAGHPSWQGGRQSISDPGGLGQLYGQVVDPGVQRLEPEQLRAARLRYPGVLLRRHLRVIREGLCGA